MSTNKKKYDILQIFTYIYLFLPTFLFFSLWLKPIFGIPLSLLVFVGIYFSLKSETPIWKPELNKNNLVILVLVLALVVLWTLTSGVGSSVTQYPDHLYRNGLFRMLIDHKWPVVLTQNGQSKYMAYYIGFWLPAAFIGKATSYEFAFLFMQLWMVIGLFLVFYYICEKRGKVRLWYFVIFVLFGGADYIGYKLIGGYFTQLGNRVEWWAYIYNIPGILTNSFWAYNQAIYAWLLTAVIMRQKSNKNLLFIWSVGLLNCTFPAVGMIPFVIYRALKNEENKNSLVRFKNAVLSSVTSWQFLIGFVFSLMISLYVASNLAIIHTSSIIDSSTKTLSTFTTFLTKDVASTPFSAYPWTTRLYMYLWFVLLEFGLYFIVIYKAKSNKPIYWLTLAVLLAIPLISIGGWLDFCMRGPIPAIFILYHMVLDSFEKYYEEKKKYLLGLLVIFSMLSAMTCYDTLIGVMEPMANNLYNSSKVSADAFSEDYIFNANNFFGSTNSSFYKIFMKQNGGN